jgi:hypothetical protein
MNYINQRLRKITQYFTEQNYTLSEHDIDFIGDILANAIIAGKIDDELFRDAIKWRQELRDTKNDTINEN